MILIINIIFSALPVVTSTSERKYSTLRKIKTYLKNVMSQVRLNGLAMLIIHRKT